MENEITSSLVRLREIFQLQIKAEENVQGKVTSRLKVLARNVKQFKFEYCNVGASNSTPINKQKYINYYKNNNSREAQNLFSHSLNILPPFASAEVK